MLLNLPTDHTIDIIYYFDSFKRKATTTTEANTNTPSRKLLQLQTDHGDVP